LYGGWIDKTGGVQPVEQVPGEIKIFECQSSLAKIQRKRGTPKYLVAAAILGFGFVYTKADMAVFLLEINTVCTKLQP
jgi:hypothetical protein